MKRRLRLKRCKAHRQPLSMRSQKRKHRRQKQSKPLEIRLYRIFLLQRPAQCLTSTPLGENAVNSVNSASQTAVENAQTAINDTKGQACNRCAERWAISCRDS